MMGCRYSVAIIVTIVPCAREVEIIFEASLYSGHRICLARARDNGDNARRKKNLLATTWPAGAGDGCSRRGAVKSSYDGVPGPHGGFLVIKRKNPDGWNNGAELLMP
jgi:hypothetical protein